MELNGLIDGYQWLMMSIVVVDDLFNNVCWWIVIVALAHDSVFKDRDEC